MGRGCQTDFSGEYGGGRALRNYFETGFHRQQAGFLQITLVALPNHEFELHIRDNGQAFDPFSQKAEKVGNADSDVDTIGILVIREKAKDFFYHQYQGFNTLVVRI